MMKSIEETKAKIAADHKLLSDAENALTALSYLVEHRDTALDARFEAMFAREAMRASDNGYQARLYLGRAAHDMAGVIMARATELAKADVAAADVLRAE